MKVQLLYFPGCPNVSEARKVLRRALTGSGLPPEFEEVDVTAPETPSDLRSWGSPTILVNGTDALGEHAPAGPCCRLYPEVQSGVRGVPSEAQLRRAFLKAGRRRGALHALGAIPGAVAAVLPVATCPACFAVYAGIFSALGVGYLLREEVLTPLIVVLLALGVVSMAWSSRAHRRIGPLAATLAGSAAIVAGRLVWEVPLVLYGGIVLILGASLWNVWLGENRSEPLLQIGTEPRIGGWT